MRRSDAAKGPITPMPQLTHAPAAALASLVVADQVDACPSQRLRDLRQRVHRAAHDAAAGLHPLDGRQGQTGGFGKRSLIDTQQRARRFQLSRCEHDENSGSKTGMNYQ
jgi:hypothetical protein